MFDPSWLVGAGAVGAPVLAVIVFLDGKATNKRNELRATIDKYKEEIDKSLEELHREVREHDARTVNRLIGVETRLAVIEDRSNRLRIGDLMGRRKEDQKND